MKMVVISDRVPLVTATHSRTTLLPALVLGFLSLLIPWVAEAAAPPEVLKAVHTDVLHTTYDGTSLQLTTGKPIRPA
jgi:hypothetical protein